LCIKPLWRNRHPGSKLTPNAAKNVCNWQTCGRFQWRKCSPFGSLFCSTLKGNVRLWTSFQSRTQRRIERMCRNVFSFIYDELQGDMAISIWCIYVHACNDPKCNLLCWSCHKCLAPLSLAVGRLDDQPRRLDEHRWQHQISYLLSELGHLDLQYIESMFAL